MDDGAVTDAMEAEVAARSTNSTDCDVDDAEVARRKASETEPGPKRHKADQVTTDAGTGRATAASSELVEMEVILATDATDARTAARAGAGSGAKEGQGGDRRHRVGLTGNARRALKQRRRREANTRDG